ncbi:YtxH domain-containing protein [Rubrivirga sp. S365]|uniref:YtxH domain-containing protein n=1 Tax=Rubrivirga sp. S365 TaxID=3076080 RepID=UPI0028C9A5B6|nr:YtxH domain-containing protein [Rubrivirga sp. S365]MDT7855164.1 YtxH domain-containing protein [Rubrivirga sp. S365]
MSQRSRSVRAAVWGFLVGGTSGVAFGLLLAPNEGRQLRRRAAYLLDRWASDLAGLVDRLDGADVPTDARQRADDIVSDARKQAESLLSEADALIMQARKGRSS